MTASVPAPPPTAEMQSTPETPPTSETAPRHPIADTADLRTGAPIHENLLALLPLVGLWSGTGAGLKPATGEPFQFAQQLSFVHDGRPFLAYESRTWIIDAAGTVIRAAARESGFWRAGAGPDDVEVVLALNTGLTEILTGVAGDQRWELATVDIARAPTAKQVLENRRLYAIVDGELVYSQELAPVGRELAPHLSARLVRVRLDPAHA